MLEFLQIFLTDKFIIIGNYSYNLFKSFITYHHARHFSSFLLTGRLRKSTHRRMQLWEGFRWPTPVVQTAGHADRRFWSPHVPQTPGPEAKDNYLLSWKCFDKFIYPKVLFSSSVPVSLMSSESNGNQCFTESKNKALRTKSAIKVLRREAFYHSAQDKVSYQGVKTWNILSQPNGVPLA